MLLFFSVTYQVVLQMSSQSEGFVALCTFGRLLSSASEQMCGEFPGRYDGLDTKGANVFVGHVQNINTIILPLLTISEKRTADILKYFPLPPYNKNMINKLQKLFFLPPGSLTL